MYENYLLFLKEGNQLYNFWWPADWPTVLIYDDSLTVLDLIAM